MASIFIGDRFDCLGAEREPPVRYPCRRLRHTSHDRDQRVPGAAPRLKHSSMELDPVCDTGVLYKLILLGRAARRDRLHPEPARGLREVGHRYRIAVDLAEQVDVVPIGIEIRRPNPVIIAMLRADEERSGLLPDRFADFAGVHKNRSRVSKRGQWSWCIGYAGILDPVPAYKCFNCKFELPLSK